MNAVNGEVRTIFRAALLVVAALCTNVSNATPVHAAYAGLVEVGTIEYGLVGQPFRVDFTYDDSATGTDTTFDFTYLDALKQMTITVGSYQWVWDSANGSSSIRVRNDPTFDYFNVLAKTFTGPNLPATTVPLDTYTFSISLYDNSPSGDPDGVTNAAQLPSTAPNPDLFQYPASGKALAFQFQNGSSPQSFGLFLTQTFSAAPVPIPAAGFLLAGGLPWLLAFRKCAARTAL